MQAIKHNHTHERQWATWRHTPGVCKQAVKREEAAAVTCRLVCSSKRSTHGGLSDGDRGAHAAATILAASTTLPPRCRDVGALRGSRATTARRQGQLPNT